MGYFLDTRGLCGSNLVRDESFFGMVPVAYFADKFGRRITIQIGAAVYMHVSLDVYPGSPAHRFTRLGGALQTGAYNMDLMLAGRFFAGEANCIGAQAIVELGSRVRCRNHVGSGTLIPGNSAKACCLISTSSFTG